MDSASRLQYLEAMGIDVWVRRQPPVDAAMHLDDAAAPDWHTLQQQVAVCQRCDLSKSRTHAVFGQGNPQANWLFIADAPDLAEDAQGQLAVGSAGTLLNAMLRAMGLSPEQVYLTTVLKCCLAS